MRASSGCTHEKVAHGGHSDGCTILNCAYFCCISNYVMHAPCGDPQQAAHTTTLATCDATVTRGARVCAATWSCEQRRTVSVDSRGETRVAQRLGCRATRCTRGNGHVAHACKQSAGGTIGGAWGGARGGAGGGRRLVTNTVGTVVVQRGASCRGF